MIDEPFTFPSDGTDLAVECWLPDAEVVGAIVVAHGMGEHARRYRRLAEALTAAGLGGVRP